MKHDEDQLRASERTTHSTHEATSTLTTSYASLEHSDAAAPSPNTSSRRTPTVVSLAPTIQEYSSTGSHFPLHHQHHLYADSSNTHFHQQQQQQQGRRSYKGTQTTTLEDDSFSISSRLSLNSTMDGIDVLGATKAPSNFREWSHLTAARIVCSVVFKRTALLLILIATALLGLRTLSIVQEHEMLLDVINYTLDAMVVLCGLEVCVAIAFYQDKLLSVGWLANDVVILLLVCLVGDVSLLALRSFRLLRALRKASGVPALKWAVKAVLRVMPRLVAVVAVLLPGVFCIFAILFTNLYQGAKLQDAETGQQLLTEDYFGRLDVSALTLFQIMTGGRNWSVVCTELQAQYPSAWVPMVSFVVVSMFLFGSLIIAVMCDAVSSVNRDRMWKSLDPHPDYHSSGTTTAVAAAAVGAAAAADPTKSTTAGLNTSAVMSDTLSFGGQQYAIPYHAEPESDLKPELRRLESKVDDLTRTIERLLRMQTVLQESVDALTEREISRQVLLSSPRNTSRPPRTLMTTMSIPDVTKAQSHDL